MRGGMEGTSGTTGQVPGDTEVPFIAYDINKTYNIKNYETWMEKSKNSEGRLKERLYKHIKIYKEMCKTRYLDIQKQKARELNISLEKYLDLKKTAENAKMTVKDFLSLKEQLETSQTGTSSQNPQLQPGYDSPIVE
jgi:hypothetical protein